MNLRKGYGTGLYHSPGSNPLGHWNQSITQSAATIIAGPLMLGD